MRPLQKAGALAYAHAINKLGNMTMRIAVVPLVAGLLSLAACANPLTDGLAAADPTPIGVDRCAAIVTQRAWFAFFTLTMTEWRPEFQDLRDESRRCVGL